MSRLWDTPEFWAQSEPDSEGALADSFERAAVSDDGEREMVALIAAGLRRRSAEDIRFWPGDTVGLPRVHAPTVNSEVSELTDDEIPW